jgi:LPXTG-motif cell wall-anchored protein
MSQIASTPTSTRRLRWTITAAALASLLVAASSAAATQDLRSPDARAGAAVAAQQATQDVRSPDARDAARRPTQPPAQDLRSPDARETGRFVSPAPQGSHSSGGSGWAFLALAGLLSLAIGASVVLVQRRRRHPMAIGS